MVGALREQTRFGDHADVGGIDDQEGAGPPRRQVAHRRVDLLHGRLDYAFRQALRDRVPGRANIVAADEHHV